MKEPRRVGFWKSANEPNLPMPTPVNVVWTVKEKFLRHLAKVEATAKKELYRGFSRCRICNKMNGCGEFSTEDWVWPEGYAHYIREHNVIPPEQFERYVRFEAKNDRTV